MDSKLVYTPKYDLRLFGARMLHPFDGKKYSKAWSLLERALGEELAKVSMEIDTPVSIDLLKRVHDPDYICSLSRASTISKVVEVPMLRFLPGEFLYKGLVVPAKYATAGTLQAAREALKSKIVFNLGGGFHHAFRDHGEGFCFFADAALSIETLRQENLVLPSEKIVMIDLDVHRGNGFESFYENDADVNLFDMYNMQIYPGLHPGDPDEFPYIIPLRSNLGSDEYLKTLTTDLPEFLSAHSPVRLAFYNAGTDILATDRLGGLDIEYQAVQERDRFVIDQLRFHNIPTVIMTSGGYSSESHRLIADLALYLLG